MATINGTHVNFVKVPTMTKFNDLTSKADGTIYFIVDEKKIYLDNVMYGFNDSDVANKFLELTGGTMLGNINMGAKDVKNVKELAFAYDGEEDATKFEQHVDVFSMQFPSLNVLFSSGGITLADGTNPKIKGLADPTASDEAVTLNYLNTQVINKIGVAEGIASLDIMGKVPSNQLPSYVDDVIEYSKQADFPNTGDPSKLYLALDTGDIWRWSGSIYVRISDGSGVLVLGETASTAYRGDRGKIAYDHSQISGNNLNPHGVVKSDVGLGNVENYGIATQAEAKAGSANNKYMTPLRTKEAIQELAPRLSWTVVA